MSPMSPGGMPKSSTEANDAFRSLLPDDPTVTTRPMFGNLAAFANGNMFTGLFGENLFVRLPDEERETLLKAGGSDFEPMPGRAMKGYVTLPATWRGDPDLARGWIIRSLAWAGDMPAKEPGARKKK